MNKLLAFIFISAVFFLTSCVNAPTETVKNASDQTNKAGKKIRFGFSMDTLKEHWVKDKELIEKRAAELGAEVIVNVAESNDEKQIKQVEDFLTQGIDVLIIAPHNGLTAATAVEKAKNRAVRWSATTA